MVENGFCCSGTSSSCSWWSFWPRKSGNKTPSRSAQSIPSPALGSIATPPLYSLLRTPDTVSSEWPHTLRPTLFLANTSFATGAMWSSLPHLERVLANWAPLSPLCRGLISLPQSLHPTHDPSYLLDPLEDGHAKPAYVLSAPHQLHCLSTIMHSYGKLWNGGDEGHMADHVAHCFDYLRQGVMCAGDVTVEANASWRFPDGGVEPPWGVVHMCRDWEAVRTWADESGVWEFPEGSGLL